MIEFLSELRNDLAFKELENPEKTSRTRRQAAQAVGENHFSALYSLNFRNCRFLFLQDFKESFFQHPNFDCVHLHHFHHFIFLPSI